MQSLWKYRVFISIISLCATAPIVAFNGFWSKTQLPLHLASLEDLTSFSGNFSIQLAIAVAFSTITIFVLQSVEVVIGVLLAGRRIQKRLDKYPQASPSARSRFIGRAKAVHKEYLILPLALKEHQFPALLLFLTFFAVSYTASPFLWIGKVFISTYIVGSAVTLSRDFFNSTPQVNEEHTKLGSRSTNSSSTLSTMISKIWNTILSHLKIALRVNISFHSPSGLVFVWAVAYYATSEAGRQQFDKRSESLVTLETHSDDSECAALILHLSSGFSLFFNANGPILIPIHNIGAIMPTSSCNENSGM